MAEQPVAAREAAEQVVRNSYGRLLALLAARSGDIAAAEDALADALERAVTIWPATGAPANPEGWIFTVARNRLRDHYRSAAAQTSVVLHDVNGFDETWDDISIDSIPDERLALLFACAHPAIDPAMRTPLMLQTVLGLDANLIADAYVIPRPAMAQRLVRTKRRIRDTRIPFHVPDRSEMPARLTAVLEAVYGAYAIDWRGISGTTLRDSLASEAVYLAELIADLLPNEPEALGLAALLRLSSSRASARVEPSGEPIPLDEQDLSLWDAVAIERGETYLRSAYALRQIGRFQLEAAIESAHCARAKTGRTDHRALLALYDALLHVAPSLGAQVARAATIAELNGPEAGVAALDGISSAGVERFQPAWATRAHLLAQAGNTVDAVHAYEKAISLTTDAWTRTWLRERATRVIAAGTP
ncbi:RNA polymerase sigma factor [Mycetocola zhadangensis]|uniref:RNA polymerase subunit sigma-70 n=1 Tax=Mycetocola zhadangensis TaxID=1164595 RepID=A0A3L7J679_9MICO|nr:DUF6596 domain-containing protein [Mycetocola zhadangensis]RLQ86020.1 RNA polymerase subunit sigma-70 [Mycetocola zhadangensis]GGE87693.1 DNA-directed RNA polymerase sigma-70 factor [Mycetocola zhadangensis]